MRPRHVVLVACAQTKLLTPAPAADLYCSDWFRKARRHAEAIGNVWFILSAQHGLVHPATVLAPYQHSLNDCPSTERRIWAAQVHRQLLAVLGPPDHDRLTVLAGQRYREHLVPLLEGLGYQVNIPMEHLGIGKQLAWLARHTDHPPLGTSAAQAAGVAQLTLWETTR
jgi:hypothetical protein